MEVQMCVHSFLLSTSYIKGIDLTLVWQLNEPMVDYVHGVDGRGDIVLLKVILILNLERLFVGLSYTWPNFSVQKFLW